MGDMATGGGRTRGGCAGLATGPVAPVTWAARSVTVLGGGMGAAWASGGRWRRPGWRAGGSVAGRWAGGSSVLVGLVGPSR